MNDTLTGYSVYLFPQAVEALGDAAKPFLKTGPGGQCIPCKEVDTGGALVELTLAQADPSGQPSEVELMIPTSMVRMIVSTRAEEGAFGFRSHENTRESAPVEPAAETRTPA